MNSSQDQETQPQEETDISSPDRADGDWMKGLKVDDMVWGKVKSHPWWPGRIFNESLAGPSVRKTRHVEGRKPDAVLVAFFGDSSYGWFDPSELIPFSPNFREMSTQANYKSFLNAVSEASDEASRRGSLAVVCECRNESKFEPAGVENYVHVDLPGFGERAVYSLQQIEQARQLFDPVKALQFVKDMAAGPLNVSESYGDDLVLFMKMRAMMTGYRSKVFEEFDKTYAEAFCVDVGPDKQKKQERTVRRGITQRAELFSGELKIAETLSSSDKKLKRLASSSSFQPPNKKQKTKTLKPKAEPKPPSESQQKSRFKSTPSKRAQNNSDKYVLKRRDDVGSSLPDLQYPPPVPDEQDTSILVGPDDTYVLQRRERKEGEAEEGEKKDKAPKRKKQEAQSSTGGEVQVQLEKKKKKKKKTIEPVSVNDLDTAQIVLDMQQLAVDPLHGKERDAADLVRYMILNFRSVVYQKSLLNNKKEKASKPSSKEGLKKADAVNPSGPKRGPSDRKDELTLKKQKKMDKIKSLAREKKSALNTVQKATKEEKKEIKGQKTEPPAPAPKVPCATALMMKFPLKTALPSIATLKAKLARFGPIDLSSTRVYWNSHMCKVTFKFKEDAKAALNHVNTNDIFGQSKVQYYIREVESSPGQELAPDLGPQRPESRIKTGPSEGSIPTESRPKLPLTAQPPKSILKRPGEETGAVSGSGNGPRVKFMLDRVKTDPIVGGDGSKNNNKSFVFSPRPSLTRPSIDTRQLPPPPPLLASRTGSTAWAGEEIQAHGPVLVHDGSGRAFEERKKAEIDISGQLMGLLVQCSEIVASVKNSLGYLPYHPL
ncbi:hypothetical protein LUZ60_011607 [Juncus effusus]|nr:hypothetical protein LUZ60_011607 [Juncus effusus]